MRQAKITTCHPTEQALRLIWMAFNLHAGVRIEAGDDLGREDWSGTALVLHFVSIGFADFPRARGLPPQVRGSSRAKFRVMTGMELWPGLRPSLLSTLSFVDTRECSAAQRLAQGALGMFHNEEVKKGNPDPGPDGGNPTPRRQGR